MDRRAVVPAAALRPALTVIDQGPSQLGRLAAERLFERLGHTGPHAGAPSCCLFGWLRGSGEMRPRSRG